MNTFKKLVAVCVLCLTAIGVYAQTVRTLTEAQKEQLITALNYVEFSTAQIKKHQNRIVVDREFDFVINKIKRNIFIDPRLINTYSSLLQNLTELKLQENERAFYQKQAEKQRKQAIFNAFQSFGSVFVPGRTPLQMVASLAYTGTSAFFNYKRAVNSVDNALDQQTFNIDQNQLRVIDDQRTQLFNNSTALLSQYRLDEKSYTHENFMEKFITVLQMSGNKEKLNNLRVLEESHRFDNFPPFWYELGSAYQNDNNYSAARKAYTKFEQLQNNTIITYDKYYVELAKNMISLIAGSGSTEAKNKQLRENKNEVYKYLAIIEEQTSRENTFDVIDKNYYMAQIYYVLGDTAKAVKCLEENIGLGDSGKDYLGSSKFLLKIIKTEVASEKNHIIYDVATKAEFITFTAESLHRAFDNDKGYLADTVNWKTDDGAHLELAITGKPGKKELVNDYVCFTIPNMLAAEYRISEIEINGEKKNVTAILFSDKGNDYHTYWCNTKWKDLSPDKNSIALILTDKNTGKTFSLRYTVTFSTEGIVMRAAMGLGQLGSDIQSQDGNTAIIFGEKLRDGKFEFKDDKTLQKEAKKAAKKKGHASEQEYLINIKKDYQYQLRTILQEAEKETYKHDDKYIAFSASVYRFDAPPSYWKVDFTDWTFYASAVGHIFWLPIYAGKNYLTGNKRLNDKTDTFIVFSLDTISETTGNTVTDYKCTKFVEIRPVR